MARRARSRTCVVDFGDGTQRNAQQRHWPTRLHAYLSQRRRLHDHRDRDRRQRQHRRSRRRRSSSTSRAIPTVTADARRRIRCLGDVQTGWRARRSPSARPAGTVAPPITQRARHAARRHRDLQRHRSAARSRTSSAVRRQLHGDGDGHRRDRQHRRRQRQSSCRTVTTVSRCVQTKGPACASTWPFVNSDCNVELLNFVRLRV